MHVMTRILGRLVGAAALTLCFTTVVATVYADATVTVHAPVTCRVYLDGRYRGTTPIRMVGITAGHHEFEVIHPRTAEFRVFRFHVPAGTGLIRRYEVRFDRPAVVSEQIVSQPRRRYEEPAEAGIRRGAPVGPRAGYTVVDQRHVPGYYYPPPITDGYPGPLSRGRSQPTGPSRGKVRRRNAFIAAGIANELLNKGSKHKRRRHDIRKGAIAATVLNEILTK